MLIFEHPKSNLSFEEIEDANAEKFQEYIEKYFYNDKDKYNLINNPRFVKMLLENPDTFATFVKKIFLITEL